MGLLQEPSASSSEGILQGLVKVEEINPYREEEEKGAQVEKMFDSIAPAYDFMNNAMTLGLHRNWRNRALKESVSSLPAQEPSRIKILDVATGTGDVAFKLHSMLPEARITGIDISEGMLEIARKKAGSLPAGERELLAFGKADCLSLPFHDGEFSLISVAYGVRNFSGLLQGLKEMHRVLAPEGVLCIIELSTPQGRLTGRAYEFYSRKIIPFIGRLISGDNRAYSYLPESIAACPQREEMSDLLKEAGFSTVRWKELTFGAVTYYIANP